MVALFLLMKVILGVVVTNMVTKAMVLRVKNVLVEKVWVVRMSIIVLR